MVQKIEWVTPCKFLLDIFEIDFLISHLEFKILIDLINAPQLSLIKHSSRMHRKLESLQIFRVKAKWDLVTEAILGGK